MKVIKLTNRVSIIIAWFDFWIGAYYNREKKYLYLMITFVGLRIQLKQQA